MTFLDPYSGSWTEEEASHLARRAGFGAGISELTTLVNSGINAAVSSYVDYDPLDDTVALQLAAQPNTGDYPAIKNPLYKSATQGWWLYHFRHTLNPLQEQLTLFLHDTITTEWSKINQDLADRVNPGNDGSLPEEQFCTPADLENIDDPLPPDETRADRWTARLIQEQNQLLRSAGSGSYTALMKLITRNPAMLFYLDNKDNKNTGVQENFSREVMELFSMGVGNYSEQDVVELAKVFTGETVDDRCSRNFPLTYEWRSSIHSTGNKFVLGSTIPFSSVPGQETNQAIDLVMSKVTNSGITPAHATLPAASIYLSWRLLQWFVNEDMPMDHPAVPQLATLFQATSTNGYRYDVKEALRALFRSNIFYDPSFRHSMIKHPLDYVMHPLRVLNLEDTQYASRLAGRIDEMGMDLLNPPDVNGWDHGRSWMYSGAMIARFNYANTLSGSGIMTDAWCDGLIPTRVASQTDHAGILEYFRRSLVQRPLRAEQVTEFNTFFAGIDATTGSATNKYRRKVRGCFHLIMTVPEYQTK
jgi:uncharacterized protein (DUF1800 family)